MSQHLLWHSRHSSGGHTQPENNASFSRNFLFTFFCKRIKPTMSLSIHSIFQVISETSTHHRIKQNLVEKKFFNHWFAKQVSGEVQIQLGCILRCPVTAHHSVCVSKTSTKQDCSGWGGCVLTCLKQHSQYCTGRKPCGPTLQSHAHSALPASHSKCLIRELAQGQFSSFLLSWVGWGGRKQRNYKLNC